MAKNSIRIPLVKLTFTKRTSHAPGKLIPYRGIGPDPLTPVWTAFGAADQSKDIREHLTYPPVVWPKIFLVEFGRLALDGSQRGIYYHINSILCIVVLCFVGDMGDRR